MTGVSYSISGRNKKVKDIVIVVNGKISSLELVSQKATEKEYRQGAFLGVVRVIIIYSEQ